MNKKIINIALLQLIIGLSFLITFRISGFSIAVFFLGPVELFLLLIPLNLIIVIFNIILIFFYKAQNKIEQSFKWLTLCFTISSAIINVAMPYIYVAFATNLQILIFVLWFINFLTIFILGSYPILLQWIKKIKKKPTT